MPTHNAVTVAWPPPRQPDGRRGRPHLFERRRDLASIPDPRQDLDPPDVCENTWRIERLKALKALLSTGDIKKVLPPRQGEILNLRMGGMKVKDIAGLLAISPRTVAEHLRVARQNLKLAVEDLL